MNTPLLRGSLYVVGFACPLWAFAASFFSLGAFLTLMIAGMVALIAAGFIEAEG